MRVQFQAEGGVAYFPGLSKPLTIDSRTLSTAQAAQLQKLVDQAKVFALPKVVGRAATRGAAVAASNRARMLR